MEYRQTIQTSETLIWGNFALVDLVVNEQSAQLTRAGNQAEPQPEPENEGELTEGQPIEVVPVNEESNLFR